MPSQWGKMKWHTPTPDMIGGNWVLMSKRPVATTCRIFPWITSGAKNHVFLLHLKCLPLNIATHTAVGRSLLSLFHFCCKVTLCQNTSVFWGFFLPEPLMFVFPCRSLFRGKHTVWQMAQCLDWFTWRWLEKLGCRSCVWNSEPFLVTPAGRWFGALKL